MYMCKSSNIKMYKNGPSNKIPNQARLSTSTRVRTTGTLPWLLLFISFFNYYSTSTLGFIV